MQTSVMQPEAASKPRKRMGSSTNPEATHVTQEYRACLLGPELECQSSIFLVEVGPAPGRNCRRAFELLAIRRRSIFDCKDEIIVCNCRCNGCGLRAGSRWPAINLVHVWSQEVCWSGGTMRVIGSSQAPAAGITRATPNLARNPCSAEYQTWAANASATQPTLFQVCLSKKIARVYTPTAADVAGDARTANSTCVLGFPF